MAFSKARRLSDFIAADGTVPATKFATGTITSAMIADTSITPTDLHTSLDLTGKTVTVATASGTTNTTAAASTAFVQQELTTLIGGAPSTLNDLNELAAAINDDANYNSTLTTALATKLPLAGGTLTGALIGTSATFSPSSGKTFVIASDSGDGPYIGTSGNQSLRIITNNTTRITVAAAGDVTVPGKILVNTDIRLGSEGVRLSSDGNGEFGIGYGQTATNSRFTVYNNTAVAFRVLPNGNVGIGTGSPAKLLHLAEAADGAKLRLTRAGISEWDFSIGNTSTLTGVGSGALEILPQNGGTANELAIGTAGSAVPLVHITNSQNYFKNKVGIGINAPIAQLDLGTQGVARNTTNDVSSKVYVSGGDVSGNAQVPLTLGRDDAAATGQEIGMTFDFAPGTWSSTGGVFARVADASNADTAVDIRTYRGAWKTGLTVEPAGYITTPLQPSFNAYSNSSSMSIGVGAKFIFNVTTHNVGGMYNTSTGRITAPVAGKYLLTFHTIFQGNYGNAYFQFYLNGARSYEMGDYHLSSNQSNTSYWQTHQICRVINLAKDDYIEIFARSVMQWHGTHWGGLSCHLL